MRRRDAQMGAAEAVWQKKMAEDTWGRGGGGWGKVGATTARYASAPAHSWGFGCEWR